MWTTKSRTRCDRSELRCSSDLTDDEWALIEPLIPPAKRGGGERSVNMRAAVNGQMYVLRGGIAWRLILKDTPPRSTTFGDFARRHDEGLFAQINHTLVTADRDRVGGEASSTAALLDSQGGQTT